MKENNVLVNEKYELDSDIVTRLLEIKKVINNEKNDNMSIKELLNFLNSVMNYDEFQIWLIENKTKGIEISQNDRLKKFLFDNSNEDILRLYDLYQNFDERNIQNIRETLDKPLPKPFYMYLNESGNGKSPKITEKSRKIAAKNLLK